MKCWLIESRPVKGAGVNDLSDKIWAIKSTMSAATSSAQRRRLEQYRDELLSRDRRNKKWIGMVIETYDDSVAIVYEVAAETKEDAERKALDWLLNREEAA